MLWLIYFWWLVDNNILKSFLLSIQMNGWVHFLYI